MTATVSPIGGHDQPRLVGAGDVEHLLALAGIGDQFVLGDDEAVAGGRGDDALAARAIDEEIDDVLALFDVDHQAHRLALAAAAGQLVAAEGVDLAAGR